MATQPGPLYTSSCLPGSEMSYIHPTPIYKFTSPPNWEFKANWRSVRIPTDLHPPAQQAAMSIMEGTATKIQSPRRDSIGSSDAVQAGNDMCIDGADPSSDAGLQGKKDDTLAAPSTEGRALWPPPSTLTPRPPLHSFESVVGNDKAEELLKLHDDYSSACDHRMKTEIDRCILPSQERELFVNSANAYFATAKFLNTSRAFTIFYLNIIWGLVGGGHGAFVVDGLLTEFLDGYSKSRFVCKLLSTYLNAPFDKLQDVVSDPEFSWNTSAEQYQLLTTTYHFLLIPSLNETVDKVLQGICFEEIEACRRSVTTDPSVAPDIVASFPMVGPTMTILNKHSKHATLVHSSGLKTMQDQRDANLLTGQVYVESTSLVAVSRVDDVREHGDKSRYRVRHLCHKAVINAGSRLLERMARDAPVALQRFLQERNPWTRKDGTGSFGAIMAGGAAVLVTSLLDIHAYVQRAADRSPTKGQLSEKINISENARAALAPQFTLMVSYLQWMRSGGLVGQVEGIGGSVLTSEPKEALQHDASFLNGLGFVRGFESLRWAGEEEIMYNFSAITTVEAVAGLPDPADSWRDGALAFYHSSGSLSESRRREARVPDFLARMTSHIYQISSCPMTSLLEFWTDLESKMAQGGQVGRERTPPSPMAVEPDVPEEDVPEEDASIQAILPPSQQPTVLTVGKAAEATHGKQPHSQTQVSRSSRERKKKVAGANQYPADPARKVRGNRFETIKPMRMVFPGAKPAGYETVTPWILASTGDSHKPDTATYSDSVEEGSSGSQQAQGKGN